MTSLHKENFIMESYPALALSDIHDMSEAPMSRTHQYRKVMKPLLERKRRARINSSLDELKDLMVFAKQAEGESIAKLEKADVLEQTVMHLRKLKRQGQLQARRGLADLNRERYRAGFTRCAAEVSRCLAHTPGVSVELGTAVMTHLGSVITRFDNNDSSLTASSTTTSPVSPMSEDCGYNSDDRASPVSTTSSPPPPSAVPMPVAAAAAKPKVWRPFV